MSQADRDTVSNLKVDLEKLLSFDKDELYSRAEWGSLLTFNPFKEDLERLFGLARIFDDLPYHLLPDAQINEIIAAARVACGLLTSIDEFDSATANNPQETLNALGREVTVHADALTTHMAPWISYLAYQKGDVTENIEQLEAAIQTATDMLTDAEKTVEESRETIGKIIQQAQDISGDQGVSIFTKQFEDAAVANATEAKIWIKATVGIFSAMIVSIAAFMYELDNVSEWYEWASRVTLVGILVYATTWCGKTYRILRHQETTNKHKANGLKSFLLFRDAADNDEATRNAVLLETTRSIFSRSSSGFVAENQKDSGSEIRVVDSSRLAASASTLAGGGS